MTILLLILTFNRKQNSQLKEKLEKQTRSSDAIINSVKEQLDIECLKRESVEKENVFLKTKLEALLTVFKGLGIDNKIDEENT